MVLELQVIKECLCDIVNLSLQISKIKLFYIQICSQCAHAAVGAVEKLANQNIKVFRQWQRFGQPKVVLKVDNEGSL